MAMPQRLMDDPNGTDGTDGTGGQMPAASARARAAAFMRCICDGARLMVGIPSYDSYVEHMRRSHPTAAVMTYAEFFRSRQDARYGAGRSGGLRCC